MLLEKNVAPVQLFEKHGLENLADKIHLTDFSQTQNEIAGFATEYQG